MRNPNRIKPFLETIEKCWAKVPDWRFGQIIANMQRAYNIPDLFFIEDDKLEEIFKDYFQIDTEEKIRENN